MKTMSAHGAGNRFGPRPPGKGNNPRTQRSTALGRLESELGLDMLATALGLRDDSLKAIIQGRQPDADARYFPHICNRLENAGIPSAILDGLSPITSQVLTKLKGLAAGSQDRTPLRRNNFKRLAKAFGERLEVLADALEMRLSSIAEVADGRLKLDDERFSHLNPRLMRAGFPNGWLDEADPQLTSGMAEALAKLATEDDEEDDYTPPTPSTPVVAATPVIGIPSTGPTHASFELPLDEPAVVDQAAVTPAPEAIRSQVQPEAPAQSQSSAQTPVPAEPQASASATVAATTPNSAKPGLSFGSIARLRKGAVARPLISDKPLGLEKQMNVKSKQQDGAPAPSTGGGLKGAMLLSPSGAPLAAGNLPRGARSAGRALAGRAAPVVTQKRDGQESKADGKSIVGAPAPSLPDSAPTAKKSANRNQAADRAEGTKDELRELSKTRAAALDKLLENARRGAKVTLWRDLMGRSLPYWGNIRNGGIILKDDMIQEVTTLLQLPEGWFDNPTYPSETIAPWVMDTSVPLPKSRDEALGVAPASSEAPAAAAPQPATPSAEPKRRGRKPRSAALAPSSPAATTSNEHAPAPQAPAAPTPAPSATAAAAPNPLVASFTWKPSEEPHPIPAAGPLTQALGSTLDRLAKEGKFSEQDAMRLLYYIMSQPGV